MVDNGSTALSLHTQILNFTFCSHSRQSHSMKLLPSRSHIAILFALVFGGKHSYILFQFFFSPVQSYNL